jgi:predicted secreted Zn-dependent protease
MTRKDYILIAAALKAARKYDECPADQAVCDNVAQELANALARDNPRFDRERFLKAAGVAA